MSKTKTVLKNKSKKKATKRIDTEDAGSHLNASQPEESKTSSTGKLKEDDEKEIQPGNTLENSDLTRKGKPEKTEALSLNKKSSKGAKKAKKIKSGCWTTDMIKESIQDLERKLDQESEQLSKSKKRRIIMRLSKLKKGLRGEVEIGGQIQKSIKTIKREMKQKSMNSSISLRKNSNVVCLCCRKKGHQMSDCRYYNQASDKSGDGSEETSSTGERSASGKEVFKCFLCGQLGHTLKDCKEPRSDNSVLPFASCFKCGKSGHIVAFCPNNESGSIYPRGGGCNICGSVKHLARNCDQQISKTTNKNKKSAQGSKGKDQINTGIVDPDIMWKEALQ